jgi:predicted TIM-barrel fold metal-dependent hydrolase
MDFTKKVSVNRPPSTNNVPRWVIAFAAVALFVVLLNVPLARLLEPLTSIGLANKVLNRPLTMSTALLCLGGLLMLWSRTQRGRTPLLLLAPACGVAAMLFAVYAFQLRYPHASLLSGARLRDGWRILLGEDIALSRYQPQTTLSLKPTHVEQAAVPAIDIHFHLESLPLNISPDRLVAAMDAAGIEKIVNLGGLPGMFEHFNKTFRAKYPNRFILFVKPDPGALMRPNGIAEQVEWIKRAARLGARGLKENKSFGISQRDAAGKIVPIDDPRMDPIWTLAGQLGMPVLIHTSEPPAFFAPVDAQNERLAELIENPQWSLHDKPVPTHRELMQQRERLLARHPGTNFIGAHFGMNPDDLEYVGRMLDQYPNYYVDMSSVVQELGRQPYSARRFFIKYQDRILFGTDGGYGLRPKDGWTPERMYRSYLEFLETENEYVDYPLKSITKQGMWQVYGIHLPQEVLEKIYRRNAERLIPSDAAIAERLAHLPP